MTHPAPLPPHIHTRAESIVRQMIVAEVKSRGYKLTPSWVSAINIGTHQMLRRSAGWAIIASLMESSP